MEKFVLILSLFIFASCGTVGTKAPPPIDPEQKIKDSYTLMNADQATIARRNATEALTVYTQKGDLLGQARAHSTLGDINRDGKSNDLPDYREAEYHYLEAAGIYGNLKQPKWQAFNLYALAGVQNMEGHNKEACKSLKLSKQIYTSAPKAKKATESFELSGAFSLKSYPEFEKSFKCKTSPKK